MLEIERGCMGTSALGSALLNIPDRLSHLNSIVCRILNDTEEPGRREENGMGDTLSIFV